MGEWELGDHYYDPIKKTVNVVTFHDKLTIYRDMDIFLPLPIDPENPEKGLWGMVDSYKKELHTWRSGKRAILELIDKKGVRKIIETDTPTLALLKALAAQE